MSLHHYEFELLLFEHWNIEPYIFGMPSDTVLHSPCQKTSGCIRFCQITFTIMLKDTKNKGNNLNLMKVYREQKRTNERSWEREREREQEWECNNSFDGTRKFDKKYNTILGVFYTLLQRQFLRRFIFLSYL